jgi:hypothetical protein
MNNRKVKLGLAFVATALIFVVLASIFWEFMRDTIVMPVYYLIWLGDLILKSISQEAYLVFLVLISLLIGNNTLKHIRESRTITQNAQRQRAIDSARYVFWRRLCDHLAAGPFSRERFASEARRLVLAILAYQEGLDDSQAEALVVEGALNVPDAVKNLIRHKGIQPSIQTSSAMHSVVFRLRRLLFRAEPPPDPQIDQQVEEIVGFIERRLEIAHAENRPESRT